MPPRPIHPGVADRSHRYAYAHGNPLRYTDPDGRCWAIPGSGEVSCTRMAVDAYQANLLTSFYSERATLAAMAPTAPPSLLKAFGAQPGVQQLLGLKNVGTSALIVATGYELDRDTIEEARHTVNMVNPLYAAPYHFVEALKADAKAKAEGRTFENELPVIEHSFDFALNAGAVVAPLTPKLKFGAASRAAT